MSDTMTTLPVSETLMLRFRVAALMADYVHCLDSDRLEEWPDYFTKDARYRICTRENHEQGLPLNVMSCTGQGMFRDRISALRIANVYEPHVYCHLVGPCRVLEATPRWVRTECNLLVIRTMADGTMTIYGCGHSLDRIVIDGDSMKFQERTVVLDSRQIDTLLVIPL